MKTIAEARAAPRQHWVGDGFPVRSLFSYGDDSAAVSPFLLLDYAGPHVFEPARAPRGVGVHPHRGFETVTIVYDGEVAHRDSTGAGGVIGPGDVQWMTAAGGILHEEFHSTGFTRTGGPFRMVQLWINLPARAKMAAPSYQTITNANIPSVALPAEAGRVRVVAGRFGATDGPARTVTPLNLWDVRLNRDADVRFDLPEGHNAMLAILGGRVIVNDAEAVGEAELVRFDRSGSEVRLRAGCDSTLLVLTGEPITEPVVGYGPFVMNTEAEIREAIADFNAGRFGVVGQA